MKHSLVFILGVVGLLVTGSVLVPDWIPKAFADFELARSGKAVVCYGADNEEIYLNAARTKLKFVAGGESLGYKRITHKTTDRKTFISYTSPEVTLRLSTAEDSYTYRGFDVFTEADCEAIQ